MKGDMARHAAALRSEAVPAEANWRRRAQPLLGTIVQIGVRAHDQDAAARAIERGFAAVREIDALMSFHHPASELSKLNRHALGRPVRVGAHTAQVLRLALGLAEASDGWFDVTVGGQLVAEGELPAPAPSQPPDLQASWQDIEVTDDEFVRFRRPLWIDLGGIAKGYAVDRAIECMALAAGASGYVNAGGDVRVAGAAVVPVLLRAPGQEERTWPVVELGAGSLASSVRSRTRRPRARTPPEAALEMREPAAKASGPTFATVIARDCVIADAMTKLVLAGAPRTQELLRTFAAAAHCFEPGRGWSTIGAAA